MPECKSKGSEKGAWYEIQCLANDIKEKGVENATLEIKLLKAWSKVEGYESAREVLASLQKPVTRRGKSTRKGFKP